MLAFRSLVNYIDQLTASVAKTGFSPWGIVGVSWPIFDGKAGTFIFTLYAGQLVQVYLPYKNRNFVKLLVVLYIFLSRNMSRQAEV